MKNRNLLVGLLTAGAIAACTTAPVREPVKVMTAQDLEQIILSQEARKVMTLHQIDPDETHLIVDGSAYGQKLYVMRGDQLQKMYDISTARAGLGSEQDSMKTPLGVHKIKQMFGEGEPLGMVYKYRQRMGRIATIYDEPIDVPQDVMTSRIMWLDGQELNNSNSLERFIYIHGTHEEGLIGRPASDGCIRMKNKDVIDLFNRVDEGTYVTILPYLR